MEYYSAMKKNEVLPFVTTWLDQEVLSEIIYTEKDNTVDFTYIWSLKNQNKWTNITKQQSH